MPCAVYFINFARSSASASRELRGREREGRIKEKGGGNTRKQQQRRRRRLSLFVCRVRRVRLCLGCPALFASPPCCSLRRPGSREREGERGRGRGRVVAWFLLTSYVTHIRVSFRNKSKRKKASFFLAWLLEKYNKKKHSNNNNYKKCKAKQVYAAQWQRWQRNPL